MREKIGTHSWVWVTAALAVLAEFAANLAYELTSGATLFVDSGAAAFVPVPLVHLIGAVVGLACGCGRHATVAAETRFSPTRPTRPRRTPTAWRLT